MADQLAAFAQADTLTVLERIQTSPKLYLIGVGCNILSAFFFGMTAWSLYRLLKDVHHVGAMGLFILNLSGSIMQVVAALYLILASQHPLMATDFVIRYQEIFMSAQLFFGLWLLPLGILVIQSGFMQKSLGVMLIIDCVAILIWFVQFFWLREISMIADLCLLTSLIAEVWLTLWLLIKGFGRTKEYPFPSSEQ